MRSETEIETTRRTLSMEGSRRMDSISDGATPIVPISASALFKALCHDEGGDGNAGTLAPSSETTVPAVPPAFFPLVRYGASAASDDSTRANTPAIPSPPASQGSAVPPSLSPTVISTPSTRAAGATGRMNALADCARHFAFPLFDWRVMVVCAAVPFLVVILGPRPQLAEALVAVTGP